MELPFFWRSSLSASLPVCELPWSPGPWVRTVSPVPCQLWCSHSVCLCKETQELDSNTRGHRPEVRLNVRLDSLDTSVTPINSDIVNWLAVGVTKTRGCLGPRGPRTQGPGLLGLDRGLVFGWATGSGAAPRHALSTAHLSPNTFHPMLPIKSKINILNYPLVFISASRKSPS